MAEGWAKTLKSDIIESYSAGIEKHGLNPLAVKVMADEGVDISGHESSLVEELPITSFAWITTLCGHADETCPTIPGNKIHVGFDDPPKLAENAISEEEKIFPYRKVRDEIRLFIEKLPNNLT